MEKKMTLEEMVTEYIANGAKDGHRPETRATHNEFDLVVQLSDGRTCLGTTKHRYISLNELYYSNKSNSLYWSQASIGSVLWQEDYSRYNEAALFNKIKRVIKITNNQPELVFELK